MCFFKTIEDFDGKSLESPGCLHFSVSVGTALRWVPTAPAPLRALPWHLEIQPLPTTLPFSPLAWSLPQQPSLSNAPPATFVFMVGEPRCRGRSPRAGRGLSLLSQSFCEDSPRARQTVGAGKRLCDEIKKEGGRKTSEQANSAPEQAGVYRI